MMFERSQPMQAGEDHHHLHPVEPGEDGRTVLLRNLALLRAVHQSARLNTPNSTTP